MLNAQLCSWCPVLYLALHNLMHWAIFMIAVVTFQVGVANRYKLNKTFRKLKAKSDANPDDLSLKNQVTQAQVRTLS